MYKTPETKAFTDSLLQKIKIKNISIELPVQQQAAGRAAWVALRGPELAVQWLVWSLVQDHGQRPAFLAAFQLLQLYYTLLPPSRTRAKSSTSFKYLRAKNLSNMHHLLSRKVMSVCF